MIIELIRHVLWTYQAVFSIAIYTYSISLFYLMFVLLLFAKKLHLCYLALRNHFSLNLRQIYLCFTRISSDLASVWFMPSDKLGTIIPTSLPLCLHQNFNIE